MTLAKVAVIDDHDVVREGITSHLSAKLPNVDVVASVATVAELANDLELDVIILDLILRDGQSLDDIPAFVESGVKVLLFTSEERPVALRKAVQLGVSGVLLKGDPLSAIIDGVTMALDGQFYVSGPLAHALVTDTSLVAELSEQQRQVLQCIDEGLDYRATSRVMNISANTVKEYLARIREKYRERGFQPGNAHHLTRLAYEEGHLR
jgi:DNA-binding NarL/FixJ family response regulator